MKRTLFTVTTGTAIAFALGLANALLAADAPRAPEPLPPVTGGFWCRSPSGAWVWVDPRSGVAQAQQQPPAAASRPRWFTVSPKSPYGFRPDRVNGIKWFRDGRSYFSD